MLGALANQLNAHNIPFDAEDRRIMCYGHIVDLSSGWVIDGLTGAAEDLQDWDGPALLDAGSQSYEEARARNPVALARTVVRAIRGSGLRRDAFDKVVVNGNAKGWFKEGGNIVKLKRLQLLRDVRTRWDSVYYMLNRLREMRQVCC